MGIVEPTGFELWAIREPLQKSGQADDEVQTLWHPIQIDPTDPLDVRIVNGCGRRLPADRQPVRLGCIVVDRFSRQRYVQDATGSLRPLSEFSSSFARPTQPAVKFFPTIIREESHKMTSQPTSQPTTVATDAPATGQPTILDIASSLWHFTNGQLATALAYWDMCDSVNGNSRNLATFNPRNRVVINNGSPVITGTVTAASDTSDAKYSVTLNLATQTHHCSCRSVDKNNTSANPCGHALVLVLAIDAGFSPLIKPAKPAKLTGDANLLAKIAQLEKEIDEREQAQDTDLIARTREVADLTIRNEKLTKELVGTEDKLAILTENLAETKSFLADMINKSALLGHYQTATLLENLTGIMLGLPEEGGTQTHHGYHRQIETLISM